MGRHLAVIPLLYNASKRAVFVRASFSSPLLFSSLSKPWYSLILSRRDAFCSTCSASCSGRIGGASSKLLLFRKLFLHRPNCKRHLHRGGKYDTHLACAPKSSYWKSGPLAWHGYGRWRSRSGPCHLYSWRRVSQEHLTAVVLLSGLSSP